MSETWLSWFRQQSEAQLCSSPSALARAFTLDLRANQVPAIQTDLGGLPPKRIVQQVEQAPILRGSWPGLVQLAKSYLVWCANVNPRDPAQSFDLYARFFISLQQAFADRRGACLNEVIVATVRELLRLFARKGEWYLEWVVGGLLKLFNSVRSEREPPAVGPSKKQNAVFYAVMMCRIYFALQQYVSCGNVLRNMHSVGMDMSQFPLAQQVEYRFWLGRWLLYLNDVEAAFVHLWWCYEHCLPQSRQKQLALEWLLVPSVLVGRLPTPAVLAEVSGDARSAAQTLITALKTGVFPPAYTRFLNTDPFITSRHLRPVIESRLPLLIYRTGLNRLAKLAGADKIELLLVRSAFHLDSTSDPELLITESICESLISKGYLKGRVLPKSQVVVLKSQGSIPPLIEVTRVMSRGLPEQDRWLQR